MKKLLLITILMLIVSVSFAQLGGGKSYTKTQSNAMYLSKDSTFNGRDSLYVKSQINDMLPYLFCTEYRLIYNSFTIKPAIEFALYQNEMVRNLVSGGYWIKFSIFNVYAINTVGNSLLDWVAPTLHAATNYSATFTAYEGLSGNGTSTYAIIAWNPTDDGGTKFTLNNSAFGVYIRSTTNGKPVLFSEQAGTPYAEMEFEITTDKDAKLRLNSPTQKANYAEQYNSGLYITSRHDASTVELYRNGSTMETFTGYTASGLPTNDTYLLRRATDYSDSQVSLFFAGSDLSDTDVAAVNTIIEAYMDAIGKGVQ